MGAVVVVFDLMITERWPCTVGVLEWCQVTIAGYAAAAKVCGGHSEPRRRSLPHTST